MKRTVSIEELRNMGVDSWSKKSNTPRGIETVYMDEIKPGDEVVIENYFTLVVGE
ncbi:MAG: hypothetical protein ACLSE7_09515 [Lachnospirales bacterium]